MRAVRVEMRTSPILAVPAVRSESMLVIIWMVFDRRSGLVIL